MAGGLGFAGVGHAAEIAHIGEDPAFIAIDAGSEAGFVEGATACILDDQGAELHCAPIHKVRRFAAALLIPEDLLPKLALGMSVTLKKAKDSQAKKDRSKGRGNKARVQGAWRFGVGADLRMRPGFQYSLVRFNATAFADETQPVWLKEESTAPGATYGMMVEAGYERGEGANRGAWGWLLRGRMLRYPSSAVDADYSAADSAEHVRSEDAARVVGGSVLLRRWFAPFFGLVHPGLTLGLAYERYVVSMQTDVMNDANGAKRRFASIEATGQMLAVDLGAGLEMRLGPWTLGLELTALAPAWSASPKLKQSTSLPEWLPATAGEQYKDLWSLRSGNASYGLLLQTGWRFE